MDKGNHYIKFALLGDGGEIESDGCVMFSFIYSNFS
jgi:hypothetical protein